MYLHLIILCSASPVDSQFCKDYLIVKMAGDDDDDDSTYKIVPKTWMLGKVECHYPKDKMTPCALEKMVEKGGKPLPRKMCKKVQVKPVHDDGNYNLNVVRLIFLNCHALSFQTTS